MSKSAAVLEHYDTDERSYRYAKPKGADSPTWKGREIAYRAAHLRVKSQRGDATEYDCVVCGDEADHWSYDHTDPNERIDVKLGYAYSVDPEFYIALCARCHWRFDRKRIDLIEVNGEAVK